MEKEEKPGADTDASGSEPAQSIVQEAAETPNDQTKTEKDGKKPQNLRRSLVTDPIGRGVKWLDDHNGMLTALSTVAIAFLTYFLATDSSKQASIAVAQLSEMKTQRIDNDQTTNSQLALMKAQADAMSGQLEQMKADAAQTERAIAATNKLAEEAAISAEQSRHLAKEASTANKETQAIATADVEANKINRSGVYSGQRAFLTIKKTGFEQALAFGHKEDFLLSFFLDVENTGNTPTYDMKVHLTCIDDQHYPSGDDPETSPIDPYYPPLKIDETEIFGAKQVKHFTLCPVYAIPPKYTKKHIVHFFFVFGSINYRDIFDLSKVHRTEFCYNTIIVAGIVDILPEALSADISTCNKHNCADEKCGKPALELADADLGPPPTTDTPDQSSNAAPRQGATHLRHRHERGGI